MQTAFTLLRTRHLAQRRNVRFISQIDRHANRLIKRYEKSPKLLSFDLAFALAPEAASSAQTYENPIEASGLSTITKSSISPSGLVIYPRFFSVEEQRVLLDASLEKLDQVLGTPRDLKQRRREVLAQMRLKEAEALATQVPGSRKEEAPIDTLFLPADCYAFEDSHIDSVIQSYRECSVSSWRPDVRLPRILKRLHDLMDLPANDIETHILHLSSTGGIQPHVDNTSASGNAILGVSLGATRIMRFTKLPEVGLRAMKNDAFDLLLESGSVYLQKDEIRFGYRHELLVKGAFKGKVIEGGQRISVMMRNRHATVSDYPGRG